MGDDKQKKLHVEEKGIIEADISNEMKSAYIDYAMSVIVSRAIPSAEDGLKPVHRRILFAMQQMALYPNKPTKKSARIVGDVIGKYHPHGDISVYDALVRMAQDFSLRYPLVVGQGNFGSIDNDPAAAMRYTEAKLSKISTPLIEDLDKGTVKYRYNFDNSLQEPEIMPGKLPNLLLNGSQGIAVGMTTNIPPHNLTNVVDAIIKYIENPGVDILKLIDIVEGPDFPTGGSVSRSGISDLYTTGKGSMILKGRTTSEVVRNKDAIIVTELPYQVNKADLITHIASLMKDKKLPDIWDIRDESAKGKIRIVLELRKGSKPDFTLNRLYKFTKLQTKFDGILLALVGGQPKLLNLKEIVHHYVEHRKDVVLKRTKFELKVATDRQHITEGLLIALKDVDALVDMIRKSPNATEALNTLINKLKLSKRQAEAILDMKLSKLTKLETSKLKEENDSLLKLMKELQAIIDSPEEILRIIRKELLELRRVYGDNRRTNIFERVKELTEKDLVAKKDVIVTLTAKGYVKRLDVKTYNEQRRGGRGVQGADLSTDDFVKRLITCNTHDYLLFFSSKGKVFALKAYEIPEVSRHGRGKAIINILNIKDDITAVLPVKKFEGSLFMATQQGVVKRVNMTQFANPRKGGLNAIKLGGDTLIGVELINPEDEVVLATKKGIAIRFKSAEVREMGKAAYGVTGIKLAKDDDVVGTALIPKDERQRKALTILTVTKKGYGKRTPIEDYRLTGRAGKGIINIGCSERNGNVVGIEMVNKRDSIIVTTAKGIVIRTGMKDIREMGRSTQGVKILKIGSNDKATSLEKVQREDDALEPVA
ncbi:DNA gyrase subunit A [Nanoarchaeota archaeon]